VERRPVSVGDRTGDAGSAAALAVVGGGPAARDLATGLMARGARVCVVRATDGTDGTRVDLDPPWPSAAWDMSGPDGLAVALDRAEAQVGPIGTTVWAWTEPSSVVPTPLSATVDQEWEVMAERPIRRYLFFLQGTWAHLAGRGGRMVALVPTLSMVGGPSGLVAWATAAEGQRALSKVAARNWGASGITVNCLAVAPERLAWGDPGQADPGDGRPLQRAGLPPISLDRTPTLVDDVSGVVLSLAAPTMASVTGATIGVDGGVWMAP
jgi:NAD(P)-dependent dehydrogenase (short-subunit alcohol dehydrogenase family)